MFKDLVLVGAGAAIAVMTATLYFQKSKIEYLIKAHKNLHTYVELNDSAMREMYAQMDGEPVFSEKLMVDFNAFMLITQGEPF